MASTRAALIQTLTQKPQLSQQMRQSVELLQLSGPELQHEIDAQLLSNPLLKADEEAGLPFETAPHKSEAEPKPEASASRAPAAGVAHDYREHNYLTWRGTAADTEEFDPYGSISAQESLSEHLLHQLGCLRLPRDEALLCTWIIGNLDDEGFLPDSLSELAHDCAQATGMKADETAWRTALKLVQSFEPAGVAASGPTQALLLQLERLETDETTRGVARRLLTETPELLARHDYKSAARVLGADIGAVKAAHALMLSLTPHPAAGFADTRESSCVIAEVILVRRDQGWKAVLNPAVVTHLTFDDDTFSLLTKAKLEGRDLTQWRERARSAKGFVRSLEMRYSTITAVAQTIADLQQAFFTQGPKALKPMGLKDVAQRLNLAESTVSRASAGKYLQSPAGTFELKYFFTKAVTGVDGQDASAALARHLIAEAVAAEDPARPLSDGAIAEKLAEQGIQLARRTVAKYRELEKIPTKSLRRKVA